MSQEVLRAKDGYVYTNGTIYGKVIYVPENADASDFHEVLDASVDPETE